MRTARAATVFRRDQILAILREQTGPITCAQVTALLPKREFTVACTPHAHAFLGKSANRPDETCDGVDHHWWAPQWYGDVYNSLTALQRQGEVTKSTVTWDRRTFWTAQPPSDQAIADRAALVAYEAEMSVES